MVFVFCIKIAEGLGVYFATIDLNLKTKINEF